MTARTLDAADLARIKVELHDTIVSIAALAYIDVRSIYDTVIGVYVTSSDTDPTSSSTAVTATGATTLTLGSVSGISAGTKIVLDVDDAREVVTVRSVSGSTVSVICRRLHSGTYPVEIESPLTIVRGILADLTTLSLTRRTSFSTAGVKSVDGEIEFFGAGEGGSALVSVAAERERLRYELGEALGLAHIVREARSRAGGGTFVPT